MRRPALVPGVGVDIAEISRFRSGGVARKTNVLERIFTKRELSYCFAKMDPAPHLTARFAAKEAAWKALTGAKRSGMHILSFLREVEIVNERSGRPRIRLTSNRLKKLSALVSLAHSRTHAIAVVCIT